MLGLLVALVAAPPAVAIVLEEASGVTSATALSIAGELGRAIEKRTGFAVRGPVHAVETCQRTEACLAGLRGSASDLVLLSVYRGPTKTRLVVERLGPAGARDAKVDVNLGGDLEARESVLDEAALTLFPEALDILVPQQPVASAPPAESPSIAPWIVLGASAAAAAVGIGFGASSASARSAVETEPHTEPEYEALEGRMRAHGLAANVLFGTAGAGLVAGVILLVAGR